MPLVSFCGTNDYSEPTVLGPLKLLNDSTVLGKLVYSQVDYWALAISCWLLAVSADGNKKP